MEYKQYINQILGGVEGLFSNLENDIKKSFSNLPDEDAVKMAKQFDVMGIDKKFSEAKESINKTINSLNNAG